MIDKATHDRAKGNDVYDHIIQQSTPNSMQLAKGGFNEQLRASTQIDNMKVKLYVTPPKAG